jgi:hypothetical protein
LVGVGVNIDVFVIPNRRLHEHYGAYYITDLVPDELEVEAGRRMQDLPPKRKPAAEVTRKLRRKKGEGNPPPRHLDGWTTRLNVLDVNGGHPGIHQQERDLDDFGDDVGSEGARQGMDAVVDADNVEYDLSEEDMVVENPNKGGRGKDNVPIAGSGEDAGVSAAEVIRVPGARDDLA